MEQARLQASNPRSGALFCWSLGMSSDASVLVAGARSESSAATGVDGNQADTSALDAGAAYIFVRSGSTWTQEAYLKASNTRAGHYFGAASAVSGDGSTVVVSAYQEDSAATGINGNQADTSAPLAGAAYVFVRSGGTWVQQAYLKASNTRANAQFGTAVALSYDGSILAIGSSNESSAAVGVNGNQADTSAPAAGAVYVFARTGTSWAQQAYVKASNTRASSYFGGYGQALTLSGDGAMLAVGAIGESSAATGINGNQNDTSSPTSGAVYVFTRAGTAWSQQAYIKASDTAAVDQFGGGVALSYDGSRLLVSAPIKAAVAGGAYLFSRSGSTWVQTASFAGSNTEPDDYFGYGLAIARSASTLVLGAYGEASSADGIDSNENDNNMPNAGAMYMFSESNGTVLQTHYVKAPYSDMGDVFGQAIAISNDGGTIAACAPGYGAAGGSLFIFYGQ